MASLQNRSFLEQIRNRVAFYQRERKDQKILAAYQKDCELFFHYFPVVSEVFSSLGYMIQRNPSDPTVLDVFLNDTTYLGKASLCVSGPENPYEKHIYFSIKDLAGNDIFYQALGLYDKHGRLELHSNWFGVDHKCSFVSAHGKAHKSIDFTSNNDGKHINHLQCNYETNFGKLNFEVSNGDSQCICASYDTNYKTKQSITYALKGLMPTLRLEDAPSSLWLMDYFTTSVGDISVKEVENLSATVLQNPKCQQFIREVIQSLDYFYPGIEKMIMENFADVRTLLETENTDCSLSDRILTTAHLFEGEEKNRKLTL